MNGPRARRFVLEGVAWHVYVSLHDSLELAGSRVSMTYLEGALEFMSPSETHEDYKKVIARLLESYAEESDLDLNGRGSTTFVRLGESQTKLVKAYRAALRQDA